VIRFDNVGLRYGSRPEILRDVTFHVLPGSFHFLTGPSGAGKTTLLRLLFWICPGPHAFAQIH